MINLINGEYTQVAQNIMADLTLNGGTITFTSVLWSMNPTSTNPCLIGNVLYKQVNGNVVSLETECTNRIASITVGVNDSTNYFFIFATYQSDSPSGYNVSTSTLYYKAEVDDPLDVVPYDSLHEDSTLITINLKLYLNITTSQASSITVVTEGAVSRSEFNTLKDRVVTTHAEGNPSTGDTQSIVGEKTFLSRSKFSDGVQVLNSSGNVRTLIYGDDGVTSCAYCLSYPAFDDLSDQYYYEVSSTSSDSSNSLDIKFCSSQFSKESKLNLNSVRLSTSVNIIPSSSSLYDIGSIQYYYNSIYANSFHVTDGTNDCSLTYYNSGIDCKGSFCPYNASLYDLGSSAYNWRDVYASDYKGRYGGDAVFHGSLTGNASTATSATSATSATRLATSRKINGVDFNGTSSIDFRGECSTQASVARKEVTISGYTLTSRTFLVVYFTYGNTAVNPTLSVNGSDAKPIYKGTSSPAGSSNVTSWYSGDSLLMYYNGTNWYIIGSARTAPGFDSAGNSVYTTYMKYMRTPYNYPTSINKYIYGMTANESSTGRLYLSDVIANSISGYGGTGYGTSARSSETSGPGYYEYSSFGSVGSVGLFRYVQGAGAAQKYPGAVVSGTSLNMLMLYSATADSAPISFWYSGYTMSGTWRILSIVYSLWSSSTTYVVVLAVRVY